MIDKFTDVFKRFFESEKIAGLFLLFCTIISLIIANSSVGASYIHFMHRTINLSFVGVALNLSIEQWVNDGLMAIFFLMVGLEVKRELLIGELASFSSAILPVAAAIGGMIVPSLIHFAFNHGTPTQSGFAIPMATDIAFALGILSLAGNKVPTAVKVFLAALAIIDDIGAVLVIAFFYTSTISFIHLGAALGIFLLLLVFNKLQIKRLFLYIIPGIVMWYCLLKSGVHATIAGVLLGFAIPFNTRGRNISYKLQHALHKPVTFIIVPIFALVNTAIPLPGGSIANTLSGANALGIIFGLFIGKVSGIFLFPYLLTKTGKASLQEGITWRSLLGLGFLGGIGFTMSMFISNLAFNDEQTIITSKLSILIASALSAITGLLIFNINAYAAKRKDVQA
ncbi:Na+/H+ antiporter NhaA [Ilyomonas limi]|uniref:Na(+)/H(+) antiporter NhaA n=1 Tax=Ilyomonas limi TaxID=2575867 RepID=A0A4U3L9G3_9BACT|nr:Na+/H+ antiporter NhaA [Ilyomonas limi]TKK72025.1 Na+/H+ antiporter NhaA [Ilyomonas limi]